MGYQEDLMAAGLLSSGTSAFIKGWGDSEDRNMRKMEIEARQRSEDAQRERQQSLDSFAKKDKEFDNRAGLRKAGFKLPTLEQDQSIADTDLNSLTVDQDYLKSKAEADPNAAILKALQIKNSGMELQKKTRENELAGRSPIPGYQKGPNYVGDEIEERGLRSAAVDFNKFKTTMEGLKAKVKAAGEKDLINPYSPVRKAIENDLKDLQLTYKGDAFAKLGVLSGPDMSILEKIIENPSTFSNLVSGKEGVLERYDQALGRVTTGFNSRIQGMGLEPVQEGGKKKSGGLINQGLVKEPGMLAGPTTPAVDDVAAKKARQLELLKKAAGPQ